MTLHLVFHSSLKKSPYSEIGVHSKASILPVPLLPSIDKMAKIAKIMGRSFTCWKNIFPCTGYEVYIHITVYRLYIIITCVRLYKNIEDSVHNLPKKCVYLFLSQIILDLP